MRRPLLTAILAPAAFVVLTAVTLAATTAQTVKVTAKEFAFEPKEITARSGEIVFSIQNVGAIEHNFLVDDAAKKTVAKIAVISPGETEQVRVTLRQGIYAVYCDLPGHREAGMAAAVRIRD